MGQAAACANAELNLTELILFKYPAGIRHERQHARSANACGFVSYVFGGFLSLFFGFKLRGFLKF
jgi:hypothetical protein